MDIFTDLGILHEDRGHDDDRTDNQQGTGVNIPEDFAKFDCHLEFIVFGSI